MAYGGNVDVWRQHIHDDDRRMQSIQSCRNNTVKEAKNGKSCEQRLLSFVSSTGLLWQAVVVKHGYYAWVLWRHRNMCTGARNMRSRHMYQWRHNKRGRGRHYHLATGTMDLGSWCRWGLDQRADAHHLLDHDASMLLKKNINNMVGQRKKVTAATFLRCPSEKYEWKTRTPHTAAHYI